MLCNFKALVRPFALLFALLLFVSSNVIAQLEAPSTGGLGALDQDLRMLGANKRVLMIGAHPDDENSELLTILARGLGADVAYLSLNRGEGGQNLIGNELGEGLGLLRTEELLGARRLDGARQFFTRAYDFGFSKSLDDTWAHWPRDSVLKDVVRIIRRLRPQIVVRIFSGTPRDGHGQHQASGWAAQEAFKIAGDSTRFPELLTEEGLPAWRPLKLYRSTSFDTAGTTLTLEGGVLDPAVGQSFHQIAMRGRSLHRSQDMGQLQGIGPSLVRVRLEDDRTGATENNFFAGIDTTLEAEWVQGDARQHRTFSEAITRYVRMVESARRLPRTGAAQAPILLDAGTALGTALINRPTLIQRADDPLARQLDRLQGMIQRAEGLVFDAVVDDERVVPGQQVTLTVTAWNAGPDSMEVQGAPATDLIDFKGPRDSSVFLRPGGVARWTYGGTVLAPPTASEPYYLHRPRSGDMYLWPYSDSSDVVPAGTDVRKLQALPVGFGLQGYPFEPASAATLRFRRVGTGEAGWMVVRRELTWRTNDQARGEIRRPVTVVPRVAVQLDPANEVWRAGSLEPQEFTVTISHGARDTTMGTVVLELPAGWKPVPARKFTLTREDEQQQFHFSISPTSLANGTYQVRAVVTDLKRNRYDLGVVLVDYPHIHPRSYTRLALATVHVAPIAFPVIAKLGYVRGAADRIPEALASVGLPVELLSGQDLATRSLSPYSVIVIGPRAWETDPALPAANDRLIEYARNGGTVIVQYQQYAYFNGNFAPFALTVGGQSVGVSRAATATSHGSATPPVSNTHDRVTDETAKVTILEANDPVMLTPNRIGGGDWGGWVQERGLYFARNWDPAWKTVIEMHDPGESPLEGSLLISKVGKGTYVYTGIAFFRQLPAGVPGAYRLFANLLGLWRSPVP